ncbi:MAG: hypothetical protein IT443_04755 [Phycisphaeraceae bacterium]|nr:hypothetical protein [Phycisphaeraceae bacterium]
MPPALVIFDDGLGRFGPLTDLRAAFELRTGARQTITRLTQALKSPLTGLIAPRHLAPLLAERCHVPVNKPPAANCLVVNGRWLGLNHVPQVMDLAAGQALCQPDGQLVAAHLLLPQAKEFWASNARQVPQSLQISTLKQPVLIDRPWHILDQLEATLSQDLLASEVPMWTANDAGVYRVGDAAIRVHPSAKLLPGVVLDARQGPIVIEEQAVLQPHAVVMGPAYVGPGSTIKAHSLMGPCLAIGPMCKLGGEIHHAVLQGYTNKSHEGFLGHALVGTWVNLGADTNVSNLKNTYGPVRMQLEARQPPQETGLTFLGPVIGDYTRTAIGSRILTGACLGTATVLALSSFAPTFTPAFSFLTDAGPRPPEVDKALVAIERMMARRQMQLSPAERARLIALAQAAKV